MDSERRLESAALEREFDCLARRWAIEPPEQAAVVGGARLHHRSASTAEASKRILLELDRIMRVLLGAEEEVRDWLRSADRPGPSPFEFLCLGHEERRAMLGAARLRHRQVMGVDP